MDVYEIERYIRNNSIEASTLTEVLLEKLKEVTGKYEQLTEVLDDYGLCNYDANFLDTELKDTFKSIEHLEENLANLEHENATLQDEINVLKEDF